MAQEATPNRTLPLSASYAGAVGLLGALLGSAVGFIPGIAVTYPLTSTAWSGEPTGQAAAGQPVGPPLPDVFIDIPWSLVLALVVGVPLFAALTMGLLSRSRLPMVARVS